MNFKINTYMAISFVLFVISGIFLTISFIEPNKAILFLESIRPFVYEHDTLITFIMVYIVSGVIESVGLLFFLAKDNERIGMVIIICSIAFIFGLPLTLLSFLTVFPSVRKKIQNYKISEG